MALVLPETADKPKTSDAEVRVSRRPFVIVVAITLAAEVAATWTTSKVDGSFFVPVLLVLALGIVGFVISFRLDVISHRREQKTEGWVVGGEREPSPTYRRGFWLIVVGTIIITLAGASFVMPLKMWVAEGAANRVAEQLIPTEVHSGCTASPSDVNTVGLLMSADEVCVYRQPNPTVWFRHTSGPYQGIGVDKGLIYVPFGLGDNNDTIICVRHLAGFWWAYYLDPDRQGGCPVFYHGGAIATPTRSEFFNDSLMEGRG